MRNAFKLIAAAMLSSAVVGAPAIAQVTYSGSDIQANVRLDYTITTDGTLGVLDLSNITASTITYTGLSTGTDNHNFASFTATNSLYFTNLTPGYGSPVSATASQLFFDFSGGGDLNFSPINCSAINVCDGAAQATPNEAQQGLVYAFAAANTNEWASVVYHNLDRMDKVEVLSTKELDDFYSAPVNSYLNSGTYTQVAATNQAFASAITGAVPEPAAWAMMILGMGAIGATMRRRVRASDVKFDAKIKRISEGATA